MLRKSVILGVLVILIIGTSGAVVGEFTKKILDMAALTALVSWLLIGAESLIGSLMGLSRDYYFNFQTVAEFSDKWNPVVFGPNADSAVVTIVNSFIMFLQPFYIIAIILTGVYLFFIAGTPAGRAKAKSVFWKLIFSMVVISFSMQLFQIILNLSAGLTVGIKTMVDIDIGEVIFPFNTFLATLAVASIPLSGIGVVISLIWIVLFNLLIPLVIWLRYIILLILAMLFPFTIFLHFLEFQFTKAFGAKLVRMTFIWTFVPVIMMLAVVGSQIAIGSLMDKCTIYRDLDWTAYIPGIGFLVGLIGAISNGDCMMVIIMSLIGTLLIAFAPLMMTGVATWLGAGIAALGMTMYDKPWGVGLTIFGGMLAGMGPGALMMGGTQAMFAKVAPKPPTP